MSAKTCLACAHCGTEPDDPRFICGHKDAGEFGLYLRGLTVVQPAKHCGEERSKFEQHPLRNEDGSLKGSCCGSGKRSDAERRTEELNRKREGRDG